jgi:hypothetical protein
MRGGGVLKINSKNFDSIIITTANDEVIAIISDSEVVEKDGYKVILEPAKECG